MAQVAAVEGEVPRRQRDEELADGQHEALPQVREARLVQYFCP